MVRVCDVTGHSKSFGNKVSHSNRKTKRAYLVNLHNATLYSIILDRKFRVKISARTLRTIDYKGGFDEYLLNTRSNKLSDLAIKIKRMVKQKKSLNDSASSSTAVEEVVS